MRNVALGDIRADAGLTHEDVAKATGIPVDQVRAVEAGEAVLTPRELRALALVFGTGVDALLPIREDRASHRPAGRVPTALPRRDGQRVLDPFWGHLGVFLYGRSRTDWYPITSDMAERLGTDLVDHDLFAQGTGVVAHTLNNRLLVIFPERVKGLFLMEDGAPGQAGGAFAWDARDLYPYVFYEGVEDFLAGRKDKLDACPALAEMVREAAVEHGRETLRRAVAVGRFHMRDGDVVEAVVQPSFMRYFVDSVSDVGEAVTTSLVQVETYDDTPMMFVPMPGIAMADFPMYRVLRG